MQGNEVLQGGPCSCVHPTASLTQDIIGLVAALEAFCEEFEGLGANVEIAAVAMSCVCSLHRVGRQWERHL